MRTADAGRAATLPTLSAHALLAAVCTCVWAPTFSVVARFCASSSRSVAWLDRGACVDAERETATEAATSATSASAACATPSRPSTSRCSSSRNPLISPSSSAQARSTSSSSSSCTTPPCITSGEGGLERMRTGELERRLPGEPVRTGELARSCGAGLASCRRRPAERSRSLVRMTPILRSATCSRPVRSTSLFAASWSRAAAAESNCAATAAAAAVTACSALAIASLACWTRLWFSASSARNSASSSASSSKATSSPTTSSPAASSPAAPTPGAEIAPPAVVVHAPRRRRSRDAPSCAVSAAISLC